MPVSASLPGLLVVKLHERIHILERTPHLVILNRTLHRARRTGILSENARILRIHIPRKAFLSLFLGRMRAFSPNFRDNAHAISLFLHYPSCVNCTIPMSQHSPHPISPHQLRFHASSLHLPQKGSCSILPFIFIQNFLKKTNESSKNTTSDEIG